MFARLGRALLAAALAVGCGSGPVATPSSVPAASVEAAPATQEELAAIKFRTEMSLQNDLEHVRAVAADPSAGMEFGVPLLPSEFDELMSRSASVEEIIPIVQAEAAKAPNDYCGLYIDNANGGALTSGWKANRVLHELAIRSEVRPGAKLAFIDCRFSEPEVNRVCDLLREADHDWMKQIPAELQGYGCGNMNFRVEMIISSPVPDAADRVVAHYTSLFNLPGGILVAESDGTGAALRPWGKVLVTVVLPDGKPVGPNNLGLNWESIDLPGMSCGVGDVGFGVSPGGEPTELPCQEGLWRIWAFDSPGPDQDWETYGEGRVGVKGDETVKLTIKLTKEPPKPVQ
jgi:hypothetical protein